MIYGRQSTAIIVTVGPVLDATGVAVTDCVVGDFKISKNGAAPAALNGSATLTHRNTGHYSLSLTTTDTNTVGTVEIVIDDTVNACPIKEIQVVEPTTYDVLFADSAPGPASPTNITAGTITTVTTVTNQLTAAQIATGVWQDATAGDFTTASSIGKALYTGNIVPGAAGGHFIAGTNAATAITTALTANIIGNITGNLSGSVGSVTGAVGSVTARVTANTDQLAGQTVTAGAGVTFPSSVASPTNITAGTITTVTNVTTVNGLAANVITAASMAADASAEMADAVWDEDATGHQTQGTFGQAIGDPAADTNSIYKAVVTDATGATVGIDVVDLKTQIGVAGAGLTAIDLPDQTMNITGNITGNLSGSVGSVTGAVGSVTGSVGGNVAGSVGSVTAAVTVGTMNASALADFFNTDSGDTYAGAVAGSVVKEIADNAGGASLTVQQIVDGVWDEAIASHLTAGTTGLALNSASSAGDPWNTALPGAYAGGTAGFIVGTNINATISSRASAADLATVDNVVDSILVDTAEIGVAGAGLTNINLPNQTMDIVGNITGNLSGSVGSVTGLTAANLDVAVSTRMASYTQPTGFLAATFPGGTVANTTNITAGTITTATNVTTVNGLAANVITAASINTGAIDADALATDAVNEIADGVWDEAIAGHLGAGSTGAALNAAGSAGDPWTTPLPGAYGAGTAGNIIGNNLDAPVSAVDTVVDAIKLKTDPLTYTVANQVDSNIQSVNDTTVTGNGQPGTEWGP